MELFSLNLSKPIAESRSLSQAAHIVVMDKK